MDLDFATIKSSGNGSTVHKAQARFADENKFYFITIRASILDGVHKIEILVDPQRDQYGNLSFLHRKVIDSTAFVGADFFSLFGDTISIFNEKISFAGDIAQTCVWRRKLNDDEVVNLATNKSISDEEYYLTDNGLQKKAVDYSKYIPTTYSEATGQLAVLTGDGDLIAWYDMGTGIDNNEFALLDEHIGGYHLTGYPLYSAGTPAAINQFERRTVQYSKSAFEDFVPNQNADYVLPFGGFPGTDGYDYKSGPQSI